jgi:hypothetical protein
MFNEMKNLDAWDSLIWHKTRFRSILLFFFCKIVCNISTAQTTHDRCVWKSWVRRLASFDVFCFFLLLHGQGHKFVQFERLSKVGVTKTRIIAPPSIPCGNYWSR